MNWNTVILVLLIAAIAYFVWKQRGGAVGKRGSTAMAGGPAASYDDYRQHAPSNMVDGKLTCNRCGSSLIDATDEAAVCSNCGAALYRT